MKATWTLCALTVAALAARAAAKEEFSQLSLQVEPQSQTCFYEDAKAGDSVEATVLVYRGGKLDIKLRVEDPEHRIIFNQLVFSNIDDATGRLLPTIIKRGHKWSAPVDGTYMLCLDNSMSRWTAKVVTLEIRKRDFGSARAGAPGGAAPGDVVSGSEGMRTIAQRLLAKLQMVSNAQSYHRQREQRHRATLESSNERVQWWSIANAVTIGFVSLTTAAIIRQWFRRPTMLPGKV